MFVYNQIAGKSAVYLICLISISACKDAPKASFSGNPPQSAEQSPVDCTLAQNQADERCHSSEVTVDCSLAQNQTNAKCISDTGSTIDCSLLQNQGDSRCINRGSTIDCTLAANQNDSRCLGSAGTNPQPNKTFDMTGQTIYGVFDRGAEHLISCSPGESYNQPGASCNGWLMDTVDVYNIEKYRPAKNFYVDTYGEAKIIIRLSPSEFHDSLLAGVNKEDFCSKAAAYARETYGISVWVIGNEPNINGMSSASYAALFNECYKQFKDIPGLVIPAAISPWDKEFEGSSEAYFANMLSAIDNLDGIAVHSKTRCNNETCFADFDFRNYTSRIPAKFVGRPVFITEANPHDQRWGGSNNWISTAYELVNAYNHEAGVNNKIHALILFRWDNLNQVQEDSQWEFYMMDSIKTQFWDAWKKGYKP